MIIDFSFRSIHFCFLFAPRRWNSYDTVSPLSRLLFAFRKISYPVLNYGYSTPLVNGEHTAPLFETDKPSVSKRLFPFRRFISPLFSSYHFFRILIFYFSLSFFFLYIYIYIIFLWQIWEEYCWLKCKTVFFFFLICR